MQIALLPDNEAKRVDRLRRVGVLDTLPQKAFDDITALASTICGTPIALISLVDENRQWFKSRHGLEASETPRDEAFCSHAIHEPNVVMEVEDASQDPRFSDNPLVLQDPHLRFYAGAPIVTDDGFALGTVCVIDRVARQLNDAQRSALQSLADLVVTLLEREREHSELHALRSSEADHQSKLLAAVTASGLDLISYVGPDYVYRYVNHRYLTYWGKEESDIVGHKVVDLFGQSLFDSTIRPHLERAMAGHEVSFEANIDFAGVGKRYVEVTYIPAMNKDGSRGVVVRSHDIHAIKQREDQLSETVSLLEHKTLEQERFIHIISHDLREPINTINNFASLLATDDTLGLPVHGKRYLSFVQSGGQRMATLLDDLLNFVRLEKHAIEKRPVDLTQIAAEVRSDLNANLERTGGRIEMGHLPQVVGDASLLRIVLQNLVSNALKFASAKTSPVVRLAAYSDHQWNLISVEDNGIGIPANQLGTVFEMFKRLHSRKEFEGSGLGLSICRRVAELHGGSLSVESKIGEGSCFTLRLPIRAEDNEERMGNEFL